MTLPSIVLVHGGMHSSNCWDLTVERLRLTEPRLRVLAVDLPGHGKTPGDLAATSIAEWADSAVMQINRAGLDDIVVVGHSMAGLTVPAVVARLGPDRVREMVMATCCVPPNGLAMVDALGRMLAWYVRRGARQPYALPTPVARHVFCNGMTRKQVQFALSRLQPESTLVAVERVDRSDLPESVPRTWILALRDRALSPRRQRLYMEYLGGVQTVIPVDTCHDLMISEAAQLAEILLARCHLSRSRLASG